MIHESSECRNTNLTSFKEKTLLSKYDIPIDHLSYEYIEKCNVVKELERIIRILRSGEEGLYPDLIKKAEEKLRLISPNSRLLTIEEPALTKYTMEQEDWNGTMDDIKVWIDEMKVKDGELSEVNNITKTENLKYPPVRKDTTKQKPTPTNSEAKVINKKIPSSDYTGWEKYDADTEVLKLDLEEERRIQERKKNEKKKEDESVRLDDVIKQSEQLSEVEKKYLAEQEKNRGNEYFKSRDYNEAIKYYSASIAILPTAVAHNNRAMCYLKMCKYTAALEDTNVAIELDPNNIKAYYRRGLALQHKNQFQKALADMDKVLEKEPNHAVARHIANDLREQCLSLPKKIRLLMEDKDPVTGRRRKKIILVSEEEYKSDPKLQNGIEVNEWGLPKTMCKCNGVPSFVRLTTYPPKIAEHILVRDPNQIANIQSSESAVSSTESKIVELDREENNGNYYSGDEKTDRPKRLEIMEVDNIEDECCGDRTNKSSRSNFNVVDMRGKEGGEIVKSVNNDIYKSGAIPKTKMVNGDIGGKEGGDKVNSVYSNDVYKSGAIPKTKMVNGDYYVHSKAVKLNSNITSKEQNDSAEIDKFYRKPPNVVPNKYKNIIRDHSEYGDVPENEETSEIGNRVSSNASVKVSPYQFNSMWISRRPHDLEKQADILRRVQPSELPSLIGNKLDEKMMTSILRCLKLKFDLRIEKELVRDYLIALTNCERFNFIVTFLSPKESNVVRELVDGLKPDDSMTQLMEDFCLIDDNQAAKNLTLCL